MLTFSLPQTSPLSTASHIWPIYLVCIAWRATLIRISNLETNGYSDLPNKIWLLFLFASKSLPWNVDNNLIAKPDFFLHSHLYWSHCSGIPVPQSISSLESWCLTLVSSSLSDVALLPSSSSAPFASWLSHSFLPLHLYFYGYYLKYFLTACFPFLFFVIQFLN